jgi:hypothetical protein
MLFCPILMAVTMASSSVLSLNFHGFEKMVVFVKVIDEPAYVKEMTVQAFHACKQEQK